MTEKVWAQGVVADKKAKEVLTDQRLRADMEREARVTTHAALVMLWIAVLEAMGVEFVEVWTFSAKAIIV